ncbi:MAG: ABC transporter ATP-binding protein [Chloroflexi bacterium]|nr:ABC transporter ATP-binding protein [Chloroflexota bacterium]MBT4515976.1 ABC transporter ATP-binding protein [Chloroflexota bacterium]MBT6681599.1 ABC transporter ATP-binding protein [Chloroflexota bacterium]
MIGLPGIRKKRGESVQTDIALRCTGVSKTFDGTIAVEEFDIEVKRGQILALVGPSGCGKTTVLRMIAGLEALDTGRIEIGGETVATSGRHTGPDKRSVGIVFQDYALFPHMTVSANVGFGLDRKGRDERVVEVLELVGLSGLGERLPSELSGGQQQRVALARTLASRPDVLLLDEPFSNLDAGLRERVRAEIREILKAAGTTTVFVTHDQQEALFMGDLVGVQVGGRIEQVDIPERVFHRPATSFVARFMGMADFLPVNVLGPRLVTEVGPARAIPGFEPPQDAPLQVMARPDDFVLAPSDEGQGVVIDRVFQGWAYTYEVELNSGLHIHCQMPHLLSIDVGQRVLVNLRRDHPQMFFSDGAAVPTVPRYGQT